jgi:hypothetical protein
VRVTGLRPPSRLRSSGSCCALQSVAATRIADIEPLKGTVDHPVDRVEVRLDIRRGWRDKAQPANAIGEGLLGGWAQAEILLREKT